MIKNMKFTLYIIFKSNVIKRHHLNRDEIKGILEILEMKQMKFKYCIQCENDSKITLNVKRVSAKDLKSENLVFRLI